MRPREVDGNGVYYGPWYLQLELTPKVLGLLSDAGEDVKLTLGANLDPYESEDSTRII